MFAISSGLAAATAAVVTAIVALGSCAPPGNDANLPPAEPGPSTTAPTGPAPTPSASSSAPTGQTVSLAVYYVGDSQGRLRLYREFHRLAAGDGSAAAKARAAVTEMLADRALDSDYSSPWPAGASVRDLRIAAGTVTVDLAGAARNSVGSEAAHQAVQQLIWTISAALGSEPAVRLLLDGQATSDLWGHVDISQPLRKGRALDVLALVWLINPQEGQTVGRTFELHISGAAFEATVNVRVRQGGQIVKETFLTLDEGAPSFGEGRQSMTLAPGTYTIEAFEFSAEDGSVTHMDDHTVTVR